ncbi:GSCOCG00006553001-RA-CDS [Cotesia congregata]|nr:GSCOCG00006553001-RA-CDS [Cotesia congregata]
MDVDVSTIIGYVVKFNYDLPYNASDLTEPYIRYQRSTFYQNLFFLVIINTFSITAEGFSSRWEIYRMIESTLVGFSSGRSCLLRVICETAAVPFSRSQGILPQLIHILLTPSLTDEKYLEHTDQEFRAAELKGRKYPNDCHKIFPDCTESPLDYFTEVIQ